MKVLDRFLIILFNICLLIVGIWISAIPIAKSKLYYKVQFKVNEIYSHENENGEIVKKDFYFLGGEYKEAKFTDEQLDVMIEHIIDFLFGNKEDFTLVLDQVEVEGVIKDNVSIFGEKAVTHMRDVKNLFIAYQIISVIAFLVLIAILAYLILRLGQVRKILYKYTFIYYFIFTTALAIFFLVTVIHTIREYSGNFDLETYFYTMWGDVHYLLFPFQPDKIEGSFFNDILTEILTVELFVLAFAIVIGVVLFLNLSWLAITIVIRKYGERIANKIKQSKYSNSKFTSEEYFTPSN